MCRCRCVVTPVIFLMYITIYTNLASGRETECKLYTEYGGSVYEFNSIQDSELFECPGFHRCPPVTESDVHQESRSRDSINITFTLDNAGIDNTTAIQIVVMNIDGMGGFHYPLGLTKCFTFNLTQPQQTDVLTQQHSEVSFYFDCIRQLPTGSRYSAVVKPFPPHSIINTIITIGEGNPPQASLWETAVYVSEHFQNINGFFWKAPDTFGFTSYIISIMRGQSNKHSFQIDTMHDDEKKEGVMLSYNVTDWCGSLDTTGIEFRFENISMGEYYIGVQPKPDAKCESFTTCTWSSSKDFVIEKDPCTVKVCGDHGQCRHTETEPYYQCTCNHGDLQINNVCQANPCHVLDGIEKCGSYGNCTAINNATDYQCECVGDSIAMDNNHICQILNLSTPAHTSTVTNTISLTSFNDNSPKETNFIVLNLTTYIAVPIFLIMVLVVVSVLYYRRGRSNTKSVFVIAPTEKRSTLVSPPPSKQGAIPRVLVLYANDCHLHKTVVNSFARFLNKRCGCDVYIDLWDETDIAVEGITMWLYKQFHDADRIVIVASKGTRVCWEKQLSKDINERTVQLQNRGSFTSSLNIVLQDFTSTDFARKGKYVTVYFDYSGPDDIPEPLTTMGTRYKLLSQMEQLYLNLHSVPEMSATATSSVPCMKQILTQSEEGKNMKTAVYNMVRLVSLASTWFEDEEHTKSMNDMTASIPYDSHSSPYKSAISNFNENCAVDMFGASSQYYQDPMVVDEVPMITEDTSPPPSWNYVYIPPRVDDSISETTQSTDTLSSVARTHNIPTAFQIYNSEPVNTSSEESLSTLAVKCNLGE
ncbi:uncharacterized protein LOC144440147 [Glandiceps talaboti]